MKTWNDDTDFNLFELWIKIWSDIYLEKISLDKWILLSTWKYMFVKDN